MDVKELPAPIQEAHALLELTWNRHRVAFHAEVKNELRTMQLASIRAQAEAFTPFLLVVHRLFPKIREQLREYGINYMEANGNMFLREGDWYIDIDRYPTLAPEKKEANRAFTKTGLKVVFQLLLHNDLLNAPQRTIAGEANVALGNIPQVMDGLLRTGYLVRKKRGYAWANREELLQQWVQAYNTTLKPALLKTRYTLREAVPWQDIHITNPHTCWGGEPAADFYTHHLRPEVLTLYTRETRQELMLNYPLKPDKEGEVIAMEKFWPQPAENRCVPALLAYADLVGNPNKRNMEIAQLIHDGYL